MTIEIAASIDVAKKKMNSIRNELKHEIETELSSLFTSLFNKYPKFIGFSWQQYTPYFNDGDLCYFGYHGSYVHVRQSFLAEEVKNDGYDSELCDDNEDEVVKLENGWSNIARYWVDGDMKKAIGEFAEFADAMEEINDMLESAEEFLELIWGDHVQVTVTRDGFVTEEYDHD